MDNGFDKFDSVSEDILAEELSAAISERTEEIKAAPIGEQKPAPKKPDSRGHRERVRQRFMQTGLNGFAEHEILELLLFYAIPYRDTKPLAYELLRKFGSIAGVMNASFDELCSVSGITENAAVLFRLIPPLIEVYYTQKQQGMVYNGTSALSELFRPYFVGSGSNKFMLGCFDDRLRLIKITQISRDKSGGTAIIMRSILSEVLNTGCAMTALAHNHPGASPKPSAEDVNVTRKIISLLNAVDVKLMDHIIIGGDKTYSMRDGGELGIFD